MQYKIITVFTESTNDITSSENRLDVLYNDGYHFISLLNDAKKYATILLGKRD